MWTNLRARGTLSAIKSPLRNACSRRISLYPCCSCGDANSRRTIGDRKTDLPNRGVSSWYGLKWPIVGTRKNTPIILQRTFSSIDDSAVGDQDAKATVGEVESARENMVLKEHNDNGNQDIKVSPELYRLPIHDPTPETRADEFHRLPMKCHSCGAYMQTEKNDYPGFIDPKKLPSLIQNSFEEFVCSNCHSLKNKNKKLLTSVNKDSILRQFQHLPTTLALVLYIVDVTDLHGSVFPNLLEMIGKRKRIIIVGNKVDMLATDDGPRKQEMNIMKILKQHSIPDEPEIANIKDVCLVSGKTGYGIEKLIVLINKHRDVNMDLYLVGSSNVGKSAIYNMLQNLVCISKDATLPAQALSHYLPGTTLGLMRHPFAFWRMRKVRQMLLEKPIEVLETVDPLQNWYICAMFLFPQEKCFCMTMMLKQCIRKCCHSQDNTIISQCVYKTRLLLGEQLHHLVISVRVIREEKFIIKTRKSVGVQKTLGKHSCMCCLCSDGILTCIAATVFCYLLRQRYFVSIFLFGML